MDMLPTAIVDAHHHLWHLAEGRFPWLQEGYDASAFFLGDYGSLRQDFGAAAYRAATQGLPIVATVHVEAERARAEALAETRWLHAVHAREGFPNAVVAHVDFLGPDADAQLRAHAAWPLVRGVRCKPRTARGPGETVRGQPGSLQDPRWLAGLGLLPAHGLLWDARVPYWHLQELAEAIAGISGLQVVLEHTGLPWDRSEAGLAHWRQGMAALAALPGVHVKLSEFGLPGAPWDAASNVRVMRETVALFGWQRCMFASNLPVSGLRAPIAEVVRNVAEALAPLDPPARAAIWHGNASRVYRLAPTAG
ncbi:amidohydrolase family protein [Pseudorhodoferax sp.]|uniref:amidohydrolase family protein n=1 Tax=Pseudorhodoferax sp. TaxID=1993553 RepID=UPI002DD656C2|nr:amidohydrolase family protein [Pseudorhodoferax sp.]